MAATIAEAYGYDKTRTKDVHTLGSTGAKAVAATWHTEAIAYVARDGSGYVEVRVKETGRTIHRHDFGPEAERAADFEARKNEANDALWRTMDYATSVRD